MDWFDLHAVQETCKSFLQHYSSKASILWHSTFFIVQLSHPYMTTGKSIAFTRWICVGKEMSLLFNMPFSPKEQASFNFMALVTICNDFGAQKIKSDTVSTVSPSICMKWWDQMPRSSFSECWALSQLFHFPLSLSSRGFLVLFTFCIKETKSCLNT